MDAHPFARRIDYETWANRATLDSLRAAGAEAPDRARLILAHVAAVQYLWTSRLGQGAAVSSPTGEVWPDLDLGAIAAHLDDLARAWPAILAALPPDRLGETFPLARDPADPKRARADDILDHVLLHGSYHRGQVATLLGRAGAAPAKTDFSLWLHAGGPKAG